MTPMGMCWCREYVAPVDLDARADDYQHLLAQGLL